MMPQSRTPGVSYSVGVNAEQPSSCYCADSWQQRGKNLRAGWACNEESNIDVSSWLAGWPIALLHVETRN